MEPRNDPEPTEAHADVRQRFIDRDRHRISPWLSAGHRFLSEERQRRMADVVRREVPADAYPTIIDIGCGGGQDLHAWLERGWPPGGLAGVDLVPGRVELARQRCGGVDIRLGNGISIPFEDGRFDVATAATVFSSIQDARLRSGLFQEMRRVTRPGGLILIYDFVVRTPGNRAGVAMTAQTLTMAAGRHPDGSERLGPFLYVVGPLARLHPGLARLAAPLLPRTHRLSFWRV